MIKLIKSTFYNEPDTKKKLLAFIDQAEMLSIGKEVQTFEQAFAKFQGRRHCTMFNSGSSANLALIQALINKDLFEKGDRVGFSSLTWATNVMPLIQLGLEAEPIEVELNNLNVSRRLLAAAHAKRPLKALFITNLLGFSADLDTIADFCRDNNILLLEDNCEALGSELGGKKLGNFGLASTFSFYVGHHLSTIEGGAVCTDDEEFDVMLKMVRAHGWDRNLPEKDQQKIRKHYGVDDSFYSRYTFYTLGYNLRPTEINGFLGHIQMKYIDEIIAKREENFRQFRTILQKHPDKFELLSVDHLSRVSNFAMPIVCKTEEIFTHYSKILQEKDIEIRPIVGGSMVEQPFFRNQGYVMDPSLFTNAHHIHKQGFYFGNNPELTQDEIHFIIDLFD